MQTFFEIYLSTRWTASTFFPCLHTIAPIITLIAAFSPVIAL